MRWATAPLRTAWLVARAGSVTVYDNWATALFSVVAAFGIWFVVQDVENPRREDVVPLGQQRIQVEAVNRPDGFIVDDLATVKVRVEARDADIPELRPGDFRATVDVKDVGPDLTESREVRVEARRSGVKVLGVEPPTVEVKLIRAAKKDVKVEVRQTGDLPVGYRLAEDPVVDPAFVTVTGRPDRVDTVEFVQLDVNLSGVRSETLDQEGQLVARTAGGNPVTVDLSQSRAKATFKIAQLFTQRTLAVEPVVAGIPAAGYRVSGVTWDPPVVTVTGPKGVIDSLPDTIGTEQLAVGGAKTDVIATKGIERPPNVSVDRQSVVVRVKIEPIDCSSAQAASPCPSMLVAVAPDFVAQPAGLSPRGNYTIQVRVAGQLALLAALKPGDIRVTVSLAGATAGTANYPLTVIVPPGIRVESADPTASVTLVVQGP